MRSKAFVIALLIAQATAADAAPPAAGESAPVDWYFGEAVYYAHQEQFFDAL